MTEQATDVPPTLAAPCPQPGCLRPTEHPGTRHRYAETKDLKPEAPEPERAPLPELDKRPFAGPLESQPRNHAISVIDAESGLYVAWDTCAGCLNHLTVCSCTNGPTEPKYIRRWREQAFPINDPKKSKAPSVDELVGIDPDYTGDMSTDEFVDHQRGEKSQERDLQREIAAEYDSLTECVGAGVHLTSCDDDGYCNFCGHQDDDGTPIVLESAIADPKREMEEFYDAPMGDAIPSTSDVGF